jgi:uncharacterized membrane protein YsdA (DUF1294 family)
MDLSYLLIPVLMYVGLNILALALFAYDKLKSTMKRGRIAENSLLLVAALGPFGALAGMMGFRHKTRHMKFFLVPVFAILHLLLFVWLWPQIGVN